MMNNFCIWLLIVFSWISLAQSQCVDRLNSICSQAMVTNRYLGNSLPSVLTITCDMTSVALAGWSLSPDGSPNDNLLDTSPSRYTMVGHTLSITNLSRTDEGLYRCIYEQQGSTDRFCFIVYGVVMFASCPLDSSECTQNPTSLTVATGANIDLNATIVFSLGGSCGFPQPLTFVTLERVNNLVGQSNARLLSCPVDSQASTECSNERVSLSRGIRPGYQFLFTILTANSSDAGEYDVVVEGTDVGTTSNTMLRKRFNVQVLPVTTEVNESPPTSTSMSRTDSTPTTMDPTFVAPNSDPQSDGNMSTVIIVVVVVVALLAIVTVFIIFVVVLVTRKRHDYSGSSDAKMEEVIPPPPRFDSSSPSAPPPVYQEVVHHHSSEATAQEENKRNNTEFLHSPHIPPPLDTITETSNNVEFNQGPPEVPRRAGISRSNMRDSRIERDSDLPDLSMKLLANNQNSEVAHV